MDDLDKRRLEELCDNVEEMALQQSVFNEALLQCLIEQGLVDRERFEKIKWALTSKFDRDLARLKREAMLSDTTAGAWLRARKSYDEEMSEFLTSLGDEDTNEN